MTDKIDDTEVVEVDDDADLGRAIRAGDGAEDETARPAEEGPRRRVLAVLAAVVGAVLLWMLFRSVPATESARAESQEDGRRAGSVESMANESDPSWMQNPDAAGSQGRAASGVVPPVYGPDGEGAQGYEESSSAGGAQPVAPDSAPVASAATADPRREAFLAALRSRPIQSAAAVDMGSPAESEAAAIAEPPSLAELDAAAQAEAARRSASPAARASRRTRACRRGPVSDRGRMFAPVRARRAPHTSPAARVSSPRRRSRNYWRRWALRRRGRTCRFRSVP